MIISHLGLPKPGQTLLSLEPVKKYLEPLLGETIFLASNITQAQSSKLRIILLENIRLFFYETENSLEFAQKLASLAIYSLWMLLLRFIEHMPPPLDLQNYSSNQRSLAHLENFKPWTMSLRVSSSPSMAIIGGAKISTKLGLMKNLVGKVDILIPGGGIANTLLAAKGYSLGQSLLETSLVSEAEKLLQQAKASKTTICSLSMCLSRLS